MSDSLTVFVVLQSAGCLLKLTAVVQTVQLEQITVTELHPLANDVAESRDLCDDGGLSAITESSFAVVHHGAIVVGYAQRAGGGVVVGVKVVFLTCRSDVQDIRKLFHYVFLVYYQKFLCKMWRDGFHKCFLSRIVCFHPTRLNS